MKYLQSKDFEFYNGEINLEDFKYREFGRTPDDLLNSKLISMVFFDVLGVKCIECSKLLNYKIAIKYKGDVYLIVNDEIGLAVKSRNSIERLDEIIEIENIIFALFKKSHRYFDSIATEAIKSSHVAVFNKENELLDKLRFLTNKYRALQRKIKKFEDERDIKIPSLEDSYDNMRISRQADHYLESLIEVFFSWSEHVFVLLAILLRKVKTVEEVVDLINNQSWQEKFKLILPLTNNMNEEYYQKLLKIKEEYRNYNTHGKFGRGYDGFEVHCMFGFVKIPSMKQRKMKDGAYMFNWGELDKRISGDEVISVFKAFMKHLWSGYRLNAKLYINKYALPLYLRATKGYEDEGSGVPLYWMIMEGKMYMEQWCEKMSDILYYQDMGEDPKEWMDL